MKIKTIIFDVDHTLLNSKNEIPKASKKALRLAQESGIEIILASGRATKSMIPFAETLNIKYIISQNGSVVYSMKEKRDLYVDSIPNNISRQIFKLAKKNKWNVIFYPNQVPMLFKGNSKWEILANYFDISDSKPTLDKMVNVQKIILIILDGEEVSYYIWKKLLKQFEHLVEITRSSTRSIDFNPKGVSKAKGVEFLSKLLKFNSETTAAFGDAGNDIEMIKWSKYGFAMANAVNELKKVAYEIIGDNNSDAISKKIYTFIKANKGE